MRRNKTLGYQYERTTAPISSRYPSQNHNNQELNFNHLMPNPDISTRAVSDLLMPDSIFVLDANFVAEKYLRAAAFPAAVAGTREHETARWVDVD